MQNSQPTTAGERRIVESRARGGAAIAALVADLARRQALRLTPELIDAIAATAAAWRAAHASILLRGRDGMAFARALLLTGYDATGESVHVLALRADGLLVEGESSRTALRPAEDGLHARVDALIPSLAPSTSEAPRLTHRSAWIQREAAWTVRLLIDAIRPLTEQVPDPDAAQSAAIDAAVNALEYAAYVAHGHKDASLSSHERMRLIRGVMADPVLARNYDAEAGCPRHPKAAEREERRRNGILNRRRERAGTLLDGLAHRLAHRERRRLGLATLLLQRHLEPGALRIMRRCAHYTPKFYNMLIGERRGAVDPNAATRRQAAATAYPLLAGLMPDCPVAIEKIDSGVDAAEALAAALDADTDVIRRFAGLNWQRCGRDAFRYVHRIVRLAGRVRADHLRLDSRQDWDALFHMLRDAERAEAGTGQPVRRWLDEWLAAQGGDAARVLTPEAIGWIGLVRDCLLVPLAIRRCLALGLPISFVRLRAALGQDHSRTLPGSLIGPAVGADRRGTDDLNRAAARAQDLLARGRRNPWGRGVVCHACDDARDGDLPGGADWGVIGAPLQGDGWSATPRPVPAGTPLGSATAQWYRIDVSGHAADILFDRVHPHGVGPRQQGAIAVPDTGSRHLEEVEPIFRTALAAAAASHADALAANPAAVAGRRPLLRDAQQRRTLQIVGIDVTSDTALEDEYQTVRAMLPEDIRGRSIAEWRNRSGIDAALDAALLAMPLVMEEPLGVAIVPTVPVIADDLEIPF